MSKQKLVKKSKVETIEESDSETKIYFQDLTTNNLLLKYFKRYLEQMNLKEDYELFETLKKYKTIKKSSERKEFITEINKKYGENEKLKDIKVGDNSTSLFDGVIDELNQKFEQEIWNDFLENENYSSYQHDMIKFNLMLPPTTTKTIKTKEKTKKMTPKKSSKPKISTPTSVLHQNHVGYESNMAMYKEKYNYDEFMNNPESTIRRYFKKSLENLYCAENFYFHEGVETYRILHDKEEIKNQANYLKKTFLESNSKYELNITQVEKNYVFDNFNKFEKTLFDGLDKEILLTLKNENYEKFLMSEEFKEFLKEKDGILNVKGYDGLVDSSKINQLFEIHQQFDKVPTKRNSFAFNFPKRNSLTLNFLKNSKKSSKPKISTPTSVLHQNHVGYESNMAMYKEKYNYDEFMNNPESTIRRYFKKSLENLYCAENYYFHEGVETYRILHDKEEMKNQANYLKKTFLESNSKYELNVTQLEKNYVFDNFNKFEKNLFDGLDKEILLTLKNENYEKFLMSEEFKEFLKEKDGILNVKGYDEKDGILNVKGYDGLVDSSKINQLFDSNSSGSPKNSKPSPKLKNENDKPKMKQSFGLSFLKSNEKNKPKTIPRPKISTPKSVSHEKHVGYYDDDSEFYLEKYNFEECIVNDRHSKIRKKFKEYLQQLNLIDFFHFFEDLEIFKNITEEERNEKGKYILNCHKVFLKENEQKIETFHVDFFDVYYFEIYEKLKSYYQKFIESDEFLMSEQQNSYINMSKNSINESNIQELLFGNKELSEEEGNFLNKIISSSYRR
eukprot:gene5415-9228_t